MICLPLLHQSRFAGDTVFVASSMQKLLVQSDKKARLESQEDKSKFLRDIFLDVGKSILDNLVLKETPTYHQLWVSRWISSRLNWWG
jgi:hypothetical protein